MKDMFGDEFDEKGNLANEKKDDFATLLAQSEKGNTRKLKAGDSIKAEILTIGKEESFVSTGTPVDAMLFTKEILDEKGLPKYKIGEIIDVIVTSTKNNEVRVSVGGANASATDDLSDAFDMELPIEGKVVEVINGGLKVSIQGKNCFCPISQIDSKFVQDASSFVGKKFEFLITQMDDKQRNIVVSRRKLLELQKAEVEGSFLQSASPGSILKGTITRIEKFGAFVQLENGLEGLVHISEVGWSRIQDPSEVVRMGQSVDVKLLKSEETTDGKLKISLSIKQAGGEGDPWLQVLTKFPVGTILNGKIEKKENFGLFVNIAPGITGLLPKSKWRDHVEGAQFENKKRGDEITVQVDQILFEDKKISFGLPGSQEDQSWKSHTPSTGKAMGTLADMFAKAQKK